VDLKKSDKYYNFQIELAILFLIIYKVTNTKKIVITDVCLGKNVSSKVF